ncbi:PucR family transcriptional regulator ligand-binding domain-containing protein [Heyndrickxia oleronia]|uniref:Transcriptional regulator n=1 Tax=Heyndrickxia oleronia TaxID=38875 RepID=A0A8E2LCJ8_9BACI|nr:PucR family transcriptional regulator [Heyndrickxia oleronia]MBU5213806.1 PucR family transcriptional regulator ligand-binding domain-containing protein [Heyndrickxia oleronia]MCM3455239.1 PucR family transcriptional regulator ligand-binding domain-containing protein [Heyndrickxia oleronia]MEC1375055.1 PucR family transcriptional regulator ligand-binding domain-containing protein [Heyndrickxia oleronia]OOP66263.1 transcriptional regulator [Heyndrickxia oleronia]QQZ04520.1 PucR family transc
MKRNGVTVKDLLQLPSFRGAEVLTGKNNLNRTVSSLSVLEVSNVDFFSQIIQSVQDEWYAEELVISSFYSIRDSVEKQCEAIQHLHDLGELGLILYYVGIVLPEIPDEVLQLADSQGFIIICMPKNDYSLRYNEVIYEVMESIVSNQAVNDHFVKETLEKVSLLPEHLQSVEITLKMLSDRLKANILLTNTNFEIVNQVMWPRNSSLDVSEIIQEYTRSDLNGGKGTQELERTVPNGFVEHKSIHQKNGEMLHLFLIKENTRLQAKIIEKISEIVQVAINLWGDKHDEVSEYALVKAIINDESEKMRRLAKKLHIDVSAIQMMWLVYINDLSEEREIREELEEQLSKYYKTRVIQNIDQCIVVLLGNCLYKYNEFDIASEFIETTNYFSQLSEIVYSPKMRHTTDVRRMYQLVNQVGKKVHSIYPKRKLYTAAEVRSMKRAIDFSKQGEEMIEECFSVISPILNDEESMRTLMTFLLDANGNFDTCGKLLYIHKNTVKYRIKKISEQIGNDVTMYSEFYDVYIACMIYRLINNDIF